MYGHCCMLNTKLMGLVAQASSFYDSFKTLLQVKIVLLIIIFMCVLIKKLISSILSSVQKIYDTQGHIHPDLKNNALVNACMPIIVRASASVSQASSGLFGNRQQTRCIRIYRNQSVKNTELGFYSSWVSLGDASSCCLSVSCQDLAWDVCWNIFGDTELPPCTENITSRQLRSTAIQLFYIFILIYQEQRVY